jgi:pimeloyl-ACP methyl ester carboxylesterase
MFTRSAARRWFTLLGVITMMIAGVPRPPLAAIDAPGPHTRHVWVHGVSLAYRSFGHGRPLLLLQGAGAAMDVWDPLMIDALAAERRVIAFDYRGVGGSSDDPRTPITIDLLARDAAGLIRALHLGKADVLGWSMGGYVAQRLVELRPGLVRDLVLIATDPGGPHAVLAAPEILALDARVTLGEASLDEILSLLFPADQMDAAQAWLGRYLAQPACCEAVTRLAGARQLEAEDGWQRGAGAWQGLASISSPTLIMRGALDIDIPPVNEARIAARIPNAELITFERAGHGLPLQSPGLVAGLVNGFIG